MDELPKKRPDEKIIDFLKQHPDQRFSMAELSRQAGLNYITIQKYVIILENQKLIEVKDFGNVKVISLK